MTISLLYLTVCSWDRPGDHEERQLRDPCPQEADCSMPTGPEGNTPAANTIIYEINSLLKVSEQHKRQIVMKYSYYSW